VARQILPIAADSRATIRNVNAVRKRSPPVKNQTRIAASAAIGKANRKPKTTIATRPIITRMISIIKSVLKSVGIAICRADKNDKKFTSLSKNVVSSHI